MRPTGFVATGKEGSARGHILRLFKCPESPRILPVGARRAAFFKPWDLYSGLTRSIQVKSAPHLITSSHLAFFPTTADRRLFFYFMHAYVYVICLPVPESYRQQPCCVYGPV